MVLVLIKFNSIDMSKLINNVIKCLSFDNLQTAKQKSKLIVIFIICKV